MSRKIALLIGVGEYGAGLTPLRCPANGVAAMRTILNHPKMGGFDEVVVLLNPDIGEMRSRICEVFAQLTKRDLILFYFTGHGIKDMTGDFYLTTAQTHLFENGRPNAGTAVAADFLKRELGNCMAERKVVILDCCFGAAFADGFLAMSDNRVEVGEQLGGKGWCVLTASTSAGYALEQAGEHLSVYTRYLVEGIKTGHAAPDGQDLISARHLHEYIKAQVKVVAPTMRPAIFNGQQGYDIVIAKAPVDNVQCYRKQVQKTIRNGAIGPAGVAVLRQWRQRLSLSVSQARAIETEILQPYREQQQNIAVYAQALRAEKGVAYPLNKGAAQDLRNLQRLLKLCDEDVVEIERQILGAQASSAIHSPVQLVRRETCVIIRSKQYVPVRFETVQVNPQGNLIQTLPREATTFTEDLGHGVTLDMVRVPGGTFMMGSVGNEDGADEDEPPPREVSVPTFWMGKTVITRSQWNALSHLTQSTQALPTDLESPLELPNRPMESVCWTEAVKYCQWLSQHTERTYQLPSRALWEYACRAGTTTPFAFGETLTPALANYNGNYAYDQGPKGDYRQQTTDVGSFPPNPFGLYDMHGNVWEWCLDDWHDVHKETSAEASIKKLSGQKKYLKGGAWSCQPANCRSAYCLKDPLHNRVDDVGFRVVCLSTKLT